MKHATCDKRHATCDKRHATCNAQHATFNMKRATSDKPLTCDSRHTACTLYHVSRNLCRARPQAAWDTMPRAALSRGISNIRRLNLGALLCYAYATVRRPRLSPESIGVADLRRAPIADGLQLALDVCAAQPHGPGVSTLSRLGPVPSYSTARGTKGSSDRRTMADATRNIRRHNAQHTPTQRAT
jgi:hypothetical protein